MRFFNLRADKRDGRGPRWASAMGLALLGTVLSGHPGQLALAQTGEEKPAAQAPAKSTDADLQAVVRERDELKKRNADLEQKLKQLQAAVDNVVHQALDEQPGATSGPAPAPGVFGRRPFGPFVSQYRPMFPPFGGTPDPVELAVAFSDAIGQKEAARPALEAARQKMQSGSGATRFDVDAAEARVLSADRKLRLLRNMIKTARSVAADEAERMRKLGAARAVSVAEIRNSEGAFSKSSTKSSRPIPMRHPQPRARLNPPSRNNVSPRFTKTHTARKDSSDGPSTSHDLLGPARRNGVEPVGTAHGLERYSAHRAASGMRVSSARG